MAKSELIKEEFPHLSKAPIVEAALDIRSISSVGWDETTLQDMLKQRLSDYPKIEPIKQAMYQIPHEKIINPIVKDFGCVGLKLHSTAYPQNIVQFNKENFVFSRLQPYENWQLFSQEALRLWDIYCGLLKPQIVTRIGLRFINRIDLKQGKIELADYYKYPPRPLEELNWALTGYLHHDVLQIPNTQYSVNLIKTVQDAPRGLILDIDVFMQVSSEFSEQYVKERLEEMRWVKNKVFFGSLTNEALLELK